jgi:ribosomal peptide maturation radical SAM protein 1
VHEREVDVVLFQMPFGPLLQPSLGLSILRTLTEQAEVRVSLEYANIEFATSLGAEDYLYLSDGQPTTSFLAGERVFAPLLFPSLRPDDDYLDAVFADAVLSGTFEERLLAPMRERLSALLIRARSLAEPFLEATLRRVVDARPRIVGFSSVFQQHFASIVLAERIKEILDDTVVVFGGANCEGPMGAELLSKFNFIDVVVPGEGEQVFPELVRRVLSNDRVGDVPGVLVRRKIPVRGSLETELIEDLDSVPEVHYDDYFATLERTQIALPRPPVLLFESSRGCWWGQRKHCTFCGLNGGRMKYRSKSPSRVIHELTALVDRYPGLGVGAVDNILDMDYFTSVLPALAKSSSKFNLFYEVKANLRREHVVALRDAGVLDIQPGIESLSDEALNLMRKGVSALQNIQLLKWCAELGVRPAWSVLWGFPGESEQAYVECARLVPLLTHLAPPASAGPIRIDRFSPLFDQLPELPASDIAPVTSYEFLYPFDAATVKNLAYYFHSPELERSSRHYAAPMREAVALWQVEHSTSGFFYVDAGDKLILWDLRRVADHVKVELVGRERELYLHCDRCRTVPALSRLMDSNDVLTVEEITTTLHSLVARKLMVERNGVYLSLALPVGDFTPDREMMSRLANAM